jgi:hypothetical protein
MKHLVIHIIETSYIARARIYSGVVTTAALLDYELGRALFFEPAASSCDLTNGLVAKAGMEQQALSPSPALRTRYRVVAEHYQRGQWLQQRNESVH